MVALAADLGVRRTSNPTIGRLKMSILRLPLLVAALLATLTSADAQQAPDPRVADLVRVGKVRIALFPPQFTKDPATGELKGVWADVARAFAARVGVELVLVERPTPPNMV